MVCRIHHQTTYSDTGEHLCDRILLCNQKLCAHCIQPAICSKIQISLPFGNRVHHILFKPGFFIYLRKNRRTHTKQPKSGGSKPQIALIINQHMVNRAVKAVRINGTVISPCPKIPDTVIRADKDDMIFRYGNGIDILQLAAYQRCLFFYSVFSNLVDLYPV